MGIRLFFIFWWFFQSGEQWRCVKNFEISSNYLAKKWFKKRLVTTSPLCCLLNNFSTVCAKIQRIDGRKKWRHFSLLIAGANASPDGRVSIAKSPKRWTVRMKWTMIIVSIARLNALKMHALFPSLLLYIIFGSDMVLDQLF